MEVGSSFRRKRGAEWRKRYLHDGCILGLDIPYLFWESVRLDKSELDTSEFETKVLRESVSTLLREIKPSQIFLFIERERQTQHT